MTDDSRPRRHLLEFVLRGGFTGLLLAIGLHAGYVLAGSNFRTVLPGQVYRCAQPTGPSLDRFIRRHGIRTVVNLRGVCPSGAWYRQEAAVTANLDVAQEDISLSATRLPSTVSARQLLEVLDRCEYPILLHCHQGADRTGLASVMIALLHTDATLPEARRHLGLRGGHLDMGKTRHMGRFFDLYQAWLEGLDEAHSPALFRAWIVNHYCPGDSRAEVAILEPLVQRENQRPLLRLPACRGRVVEVRCRNTSLEPWHFHPGGNVGVHLWWTLLGRDEKLVSGERAGLFHATVAPGEHIDLKLALPPLKPGTYELRLDLSNEQHGFFAQLGNDLYVIELEAT